MILARDGLLVMDWPAGVNVGPEGYYLAYGSEDGFGAALDFTERLVARKTPAWPSGHPGGYGHGLYGHGGYGHGYYGAGYGVGMWGTGPWGRGTAARQAASGPKLDGRWQVQAVGYDEADNASPLADRVQAQVQLAGTPEPCGVPTAAWSAGTLTLTFTVSTDDEG
ncbi:MAG TPA: hypothetical protein VM431_01275 [Phycisphaerae bacterium]|nr:hypothetical protein [Phycisphaerae bacterium]